MVLKKQVHITVPLPTGAQIQFTVKYSVLGPLVLVCLLMHHRANWTAIAGSLYNLTKHRTHETLLID